VNITNVLRGGAAEKAGFASGDEWLGIAVTTDRETRNWRIHSLDDLLLYSGKAKKVEALVARDKRLLTLTLSMPKATQAVRLTVKDEAKVTQWLAGATTAP
jgi:predicted metalloprotease with PDZ domain